MRRMIALAWGFRLWLLLMAVTAIGAKSTLRNDPDYLIDTWETEDGLPENSATAMAQTLDGDLWFGTFNGLVRFDGVKFTVFNSQNTSQLPGAAVVNVHADGLNRLWVSTDKGLALRTGTQWQGFDKQAGWPAGDFARTSKPCSRRRCAGNWSMGIHAGNKHSSGDYETASKIARDLRLCAWGHRRIERIESGSSPALFLIPLTRFPGFIWLKAEL